MDGSIDGSVEPAASAAKIRKTNRENPKIHEILAEQEACILPKDTANLGVGGWNWRIGGSKLQNEKKSRKTQRSSFFYHGVAVLPTPEKSIF